MHDRLLDLDPAAFAEHFAARPMALRHGLVDHPLLTLDALGDLADALPADQVEHNLGAVPEVLGRDTAAPQADLTPGEVARSIDTNGCWMVLKRVEQVPAYRALLDACLDEVAPLVQDREGGMAHREAFVFLSAAGSVTPSHIDPEHNFLLQVRGTKDMVVGAFPDPATEQRELERYHSGSHRNLDWRPDEATTFPMAPGDGVYVPVHAPHLVRNGPSPSISFSITWYTPAVQQAQRLHQVNARLRRLHLSPGMPGRRPRADRLKLGLVDARAKVRT